MAVPTWQDLALPLLETLAETEDLSGTALRRAVADRLGLSDEQRTERLGGGRQTRLTNHLAWAKIRLRDAGLVRDEGQGQPLRLTDAGRAVLADPPARITVEFLAGVAPRDAELAAPADETPDDRTPEEHLHVSHRQIHRALADELLKRIQANSPAFFERLVIDVLVAMGYGGSRADAQAVGRGGDGGIDGVINEDRLGLEQIYVQAKRWKGSVGRPVVQAFAGSLEGFKARKGILITTSWFTADAEDYVEQIEKRIVLISGRQLAELMIEHGVGVTEVERFTVTRLDLDYFEEG